MGLAYHIPRTIFGASAILLAGTASGQAPPSGEEITIDGRTPKQTKALVEAVTDVPRGEPIAVFRDWLCIEVQGLKPEFARLISDRMAQVARDAGAHVDTGHCASNVVVVVPPDPAGFVRDMLKRHPMLFGDPSRGMAPPETVAALRQPRAVRWFATREIVTARQ